MYTTIDWTNAQSIRRLALEQERNLGPCSTELAITLTRLGDVYMVQRDFDNAEDCYWRALCIRQRVLGEACQETASNLN
jgi:tetratricopeptide (TPR) repeat protein